MSTASTRSMVRSIRLDEASVEALLNRLDVGSETHASEGRKSERFQYRVKACVLHLQQPGDATSTPFLVPTRNISSGGLSFLHGGFVHVGSRCVAQLITLHGTWNDSKGTVVRCRHIDGRVHEVAVSFDLDIEPADYCESAMKCRVLLAEDDPASARLATHLLKQLNASVDHAENGRQTVEMAGKKLYDVVLMDVEMPELNGLDATRELRSRGYSGHIAAATARTSPADREQCLNAGCDHYIVKPLTRKALEDLLKSLKEEPLISSLQGDGSMIDLIAIFVEELPKTLRNIEESLASDDMEGLERECRALKGNAAGYGFEPIAQTAGDVETGVQRKSNRAEIEGLVSALAKHCLLARSSTRLFQGDSRGNL